MPPKTTRKKKPDLAAQLKEAKSDAHRLSVEVTRLANQLVLHDQILGLAVAFRIAPSIFVEWRRPPATVESAGWWAIARKSGGAGGLTEVMDRKGHWENEPGEHARTDMLRERYYYPTVGEAIATFAAHHATDMKQVLPDPVREGLLATTKAVLEAGGTVSPEAAEKLATLQMAAVEEDAAAGLHGLSRRAPTAEAAGYAVADFAQPKLQAEGP